MAKVYANQIRRGAIINSDPPRRMTIEDVPERWRDEVETLLKKDGANNG